VKTTIYLIRHAEAYGNKHRVFHGISDSSLTENGMEQVKRAAKALMQYEIDTVYSSDLKRAYMTAAYYADMAGLIVKIDKGLREIDGGEWEDLPWSVLPKRFPNEYYTWENEPHLHKMPKGESMYDLKIRMTSILMKIVSQNPGSRIAVFTHGTAIRVLLAEISGIGFLNLKEIDWHENTAITKIIFDKERFVIEFEGDHSHLDLSQTTILNQGWNEKRRKL
jgi:broad specificity phosphatase PhoE